MLQAQIHDDGKIGWEQRHAGTSAKKTQKDVGDGSGYRLGPSHHKRPFQYLIKERG